MSSLLLSCFTNSYGRFGPRVAIERIRSAGIGHLELAIKTRGVKSIFGEEPILTDRSTPGDVDAVRALLDEHGVRLSSCNITSGNPLDAEVVAITRRKLKRAADLGVSLVVAGAGEADSPGDRARLDDHLRRIGDFAGQHGITCCFETHPGLCRNAEGMRETMERLAHPQLRLNFDTGNILFYNRSADGLEQLRRVVSYVRHVHLKDHNGRFEDWHFPALGAGGAVDFAAVREVLEQAGFDGPCSLEIEGIQGEPPLTLDETHQRIVESVAHVKSCGFGSAAG